MPRVIRHAGWQSNVAGTKGPHPGAMVSSFAYRTEVTMSKRQQTRSSLANSRYKRKLAVHERDRYQCGNCAVQTDASDYFHAHHVEARAIGGSDRMQNLSTLCPPCHEAIHKAMEGDDSAHGRTVRFTTDSMDEYEFGLFKHFANHQLPALTRMVVEPEMPLRFNLAENKSWHAACGDLRRIDTALEEMDIEYEPLPEWAKRRPAEQTAAHHFM